MIKIGIVSDLHTEFWSQSHIARLGTTLLHTLAKADCILLAGDIGNGSGGIGIVRSLFPTKPVFIVAGNHEFYSHDYHQVLRDLQTAAGDNIHFLHQSVGHITINDTPIRIIGATLWTDFDLYSTVDLSLFDARRGLSDFRLIRYDGRVLTPRDTLDWHIEQRAWLLDTLDIAYDGLTILLTHHAPVSFAVHPHFQGDALSPCFASRMEHLLIRDDLPLVVWGHTHHCVDRTIDKTRFVSNQTGYVVGGPSLTETGKFGTIVEL